MTKKELTSVYYIKKEIKMWEEQLELIESKAEGLSLIHILELSGMDVLANKGRKFNVNKFITSLHNKPYLEYLAKAGLSRLTAEITDDYGWWGDPDEILSLIHIYRQQLL